MASPMISNFCLVLFLAFCCWGGVGRLGKRLAKLKKGVTYFCTLEIHFNLVECVEDFILSHM